MDTNRLPKLLRLPGFEGFRRFTDTGIGPTTLIGGDTFSVYEKIAPFGKPLHAVHVSEVDERPGEYLALEELDFGPFRGRYVRVRYRGSDLEMATAVAGHVRAADIAGNRCTRPFDAGENRLSLMPERVSARRDQLHSLRELNA